MALISAEKQQFLPRINALPHPPGLKDSGSDKYTMENPHERQF
jgi:hypothetical protein